MARLTWQGVIGAILCCVFVTCSYGEEGKVSGSDVRGLAGETLEAAKKYALQQKAEYEQKVAQELAELQVKIASLKEKAGNATGESLRIMKEKIKEVREQQAAAEKKLSELKDSTAQAWQEMRGGMERAISDVKKAYENAASYFK